jgi:glycosyltransferase involved in cell wall biosynthesis
MSAPFVSCVMPTCDRRRFIPQALRCFANRTYRNAELIVVDDSEQSVRSLCEGVEGVRYLRVRIASSGLKLNIGIEAARGDILHKIDDDDYYGPRFLQSSVEHLLGKDHGRTLVTRCCFLTLVRSDGILRHSGHGWTAGGGFCFFRDLWRRIPFRDAPSSEDSHFLRDLRPDVVRICDAEQYIVVRHGRNHWTRLRLKDFPKAMETDDYFRSLPAFEKTTAELLDGDTQEFYRRVLRWKRARHLR